MLQTTTKLSGLVDLTRKRFAAMEADFLATGIASQLFMELPPSEGESIRIDEFDTETFGEDKPEGSDAVSTDSDFGYNVTLSYRRIAREATITWEMEANNRYREIGTKLKSLIHFVPNRFELDLTHIFTFASSTEYTNLSGNSIAVDVGDDLAVASTVHTLNQSSSTYSNRLSGDPAFSKGSLESALTLANTDILSSFGGRRVLNFNTIVTGRDPNTVHTVREYLMSQGAPDAAHSGVYNVIKDYQYKHVILPYLDSTATGANDSTKKRWWALLAIGNGEGKSFPAYYSVKERPTLLTPEIKDADIHNDNRTFGTRGYYGIRVLSGRGAIFSLPTS